MRTMVGGAMAVLLLTLPPVPSPGTSGGPDAPVAWDGAVPFSAEDAARAVRGAATVGRDPAGDAAEAGAARPWFRTYGGPPAPPKAPGLPDLLGPSLKAGCDISCIVNNAVNIALGVYVTTGAPTQFQAGPAGANLVGEASAPVAASGNGTARGGLLGASVTGNATCNDVQCVAASLTGQSSGYLTFSLLGTCNGRPCVLVATEPGDDAYAGSVGVALQGDSDGYLAVSGVGDSGSAASFAAVSGVGNARSHAVAVSGVGSAQGGEVAVSGAGGSAGRTLAVSGVGPSAGAIAVSGAGDSAGFTAGGAGLAAGVSGIGNARANRDGGVAVSGVGASDGDVAVSGAGDSHGEAAGVSGIGASQGFVAASGIGDSGNASSNTAVSGTGSATAHGFAVSGVGDSQAPVAVSGTGDSQGDIAVSGTGHAEGWVAVSGCNLVAAACVDPL